MTEGIAFGYPINEGGEEVAGFAAMGYN